MAVSALGILGLKRKCRGPFLKPVRYRAAHKRCRSRKGGARKFSCSGIGAQGPASYSSFYVRGTPASKANPVVVATELPLRGSCRGPHRYGRLHRPCCRQESLCSTFKLVLGKGLVVKPTGLETKNVSIMAT